MVGVGDQVAGAFPAADVARRVGPGRTLQLALAAEEVEVDRRGHQAESRQERADLAEAGVDLVAGEEEPLRLGARLGHRLVAIGGREHEAAHAQVRQVFQEHGNFVDLALAVDRRIGADLEAGLHGGLDAGHRLLEHAGPLHDPVVRGLHAVQMDVDEQARGGPQPGELLGQEHAVGAEIDVLAAAHDPLDKLLDARVDERLAAADAHHRGAALVDRSQALAEREGAVHGVGVLADPAAPAATQVAGEQRLQHEHQGELLLAGKPLLEEVAGQGTGQGERESHGEVLSNEC